MLWKLMTVVTFIALVESFHFEYRPNKKAPACIIADIDTNNTLTRTNGSSTQSVPPYSLEGTNVTGGSCGPKNVYVNLVWAEDGASIQFSFRNDSGNVGMDMVFTFQPSNIWNGTSSESVVMQASKPLKIGHTGSSFECHSPQTVNFVKTTNNSVTYQAVWNVKNIHIQAFDVENSTYSKAEVCSQDSTTTVSPSNHTTETPHPTTEHSNGTTEHTNGTTVPTTEHSNITTPTTIPTPTTQPPSKHPGNQYTFNASDHHSRCVLLKAQILFTIPNPNDSKPVQVGIPSEFDVDGSCNFSGQGLNMLEIQFRKNWSVQFIFANSDTKAMLGDSKDKMFWWRQLSLTYVYETELFPGLNSTLANSSHTVVKNFSDSDKKYGADMDGSYMCNTGTTLDLGKNIKMETWDLQYFAFENKTKFDTDDSKISQCSSDSKTNSVVPIAVGAALAGLVVIVLIAYLIGRRRNRKGYESV